MSAAVYRFLSAEVHPDQRLLRVDGVDRQVGARAFDLLLALVERRDRVVSKSELLDVVWPGVVVEENNLQVHVSSLRRLLGARAVATIPGRGYRFVAPLAADESTPMATPAAADRSAADALVAPASLPSLAPSIFGRDRDLEAVADHLAAHRLVTILGAGGIGKSRLARAVAENERRRDVRWVDLAALIDPELLAMTVARQLEITVGERGAAERAIVDAVGSRELLLVLDNCEHLLEAVASLVDWLLRSAPGLAVLTTSQEPLHIADELQYRLDALAVPRDASAPDARGYGALRLLEARVHAAAPRFAFTDADLPVAIELCRALDGLPLAIELAAARVPLIGLRAVRARLGERFQLLTAGTRTALRRHQTLRAAMEWSHSLLNDAQRALFRRLGVFSGGFTMELAQAACTDAANDEWAVLEQLAALVDKSLVVADAGEPLRYRLLESPRAYALEQLAAAGETGDALRRHATAMVQLLRCADDGNMDSTLLPDEYNALLLPEFDNLRAARAWAIGEQGDPALALGLAAHAGPLIDYSMEFVEWLLAESGRVPPAASDALTQARFWRALAAPNMAGTRTFAELAEAAQRAVDAYRPLDRPRRLFASLRLLGTWRRLAGDLDAADRAVREAESLLRPDWPAEFHIRVLRARAAASWRAVDYPKAIRLFEEARQLGRQAGDWRLEAIDECSACTVLWQAGRLDEAATRLAAILEVPAGRAIPDYDWIDAAAIRIGVLVEADRLDEAVAETRRALPVMRRMPKFMVEPFALLLARLGHYDAAARVRGRLLARLQAGREYRDPNGERIAEATLGLLQAQLSPAKLASALEAGASLSSSDVCRLLAEALE